MCVLNEQTLASYVTTNLNLSMSIVVKKQFLLKRGGAAVKRYTMYLLQEMDLLRKRVNSLTEENGKLLGHQNLNQKIQYLVKLKKDYAKLTEVSCQVEYRWSNGLA